MTALALALVGLAWAAAASYGILEASKAHARRYEARHLDRLVALDERLTELELKWKSAVVSGASRRIG